MLFSVLAFTCLNVLAKYLVNISAYQIVFFRCLGTFLICMSLLQWQQIPILGKQKKLLIARSIVGISSMTLFFLAVKELPLGAVISLRYLSPIFAAIFAILLLKEQITKLQFGCFMLAFFGVLLLKGFDTNINTLGLIYILLSAIFSGMVYVIIRTIGQGDHPLVVVNYFMFFGVIVGGTLSFFDWQTPQMSDWPLLISLGIFGFFGQYFMTKAYQIAAVTTVAPMKYLEAVFAIIIGWIWFQDTYTIWSFLGVAIIIGSMLANLFFQSKK